MDEKLQKEMMAYYDQRAEEYDEIYLGKGPAIPDSLAYKNDVKKISQMVSKFGKGNLIDIACGTGFWLPYYESNCSKITLIDQSEKMFSQCQRKVDELGIKSKCHFVQKDFFKVKLGNSVFERAIVGFFISHLSRQHQQVFFERLKKILKSDAQLMIIDSAWSKKRQKYRKKEGIQERVLSDGRTFNVYKRYFDQPDIEEMFRRYLFTLKSSYMGDVFLAAIGENRK